MNYKLPHKWVCFLVLLTSCFVSTIQQTERETKGRKYSANITSHVGDFYGIP